MADVDKEAADFVREKITDLNMALWAAGKAGLEIEIDQREGTEMGDPTRRLILVAKCYRVIKV